MCRKDLALHTHEPQVPVKDWKKQKGEESDPIGVPIKPTRARSTCLSELRKDSTFLFKILFLSFYFLLFQFTV